MLRSITQHVIIARTLALTASLTSVLGCGVAKAQVSYTSVDHITSFTDLPGMTGTGIIYNNSGFRLWPKHIKALSDAGTCIRLTSFASIESSGEVYFSVDYNDINVMRKFQSQPIVFTSQIMGRKLDGTWVTLSSSDYNAPGSGFAMTTIPGHEYVVIQKHSIVATAAINESYTDIHGRICSFNHSFTPDTSGVGMIDIKSTNLMLKIPE